MPSRSSSRASPTASRRSGSTSDFPVAPAAATHAFAALAVARGADVRPGEDAAIELYGGIAAGVRTPGGVDAGRIGGRRRRPVDPGGHRSERHLAPDPAVLGRDRRARARHRRRGTCWRRPTSTPPSSPTAAWRDEADGTAGFSLVPAAGRSSLGSTFLPFEPDPRDYEARLRADGARYLPAIAGTPTQRAAGVREAARARRASAGGRGARASTGCSSPPGTARGGSRPGRRRRSRRRARARRRGPADAGRRGRDVGIEVRRPARLIRPPVSASCWGRTGRRS